MHANELHDKIKKSVRTYSKQERKARQNGLTEEEKMSIKICREANVPSPSIVTSDEHSPSPQPTHHRTTHITLAPPQLHHTKYQLPNPEPKFD